ncbi:P-loop containing nucleoside triphosphate hydrolase protein [Guyanagaster necrorhizus]|uniref:P-loop containing nucleoside triphosphate hydrolase protein n=1 Tax=Guyanagaster necrorhizus TaxID=856835 RepID=A0A9P7W5D3_9AGAR|nr:P-loop containing nucleoside triphosphate hydrolase protein [Guyanagaster necrorhizus MCA 3950]KAG7452770.1 P-loop containing nucleoside triphosphate hydrolase protein [Guyanagaster necrorhizus MCA 3950]
MQKPKCIQVGYTIRFEDVSDKERTRILYMTDGMLFRETLVDPLLTRYSVIMIDEAHERSTYTDLLLGILKKIRRKRPSLRIIVSSATLDASYFLDYFTAATSPGEATIVSLEGRMFPVDVAYSEQPVPDYVRFAAETAFNINLQVALLELPFQLINHSSLPRSALRIVPLPLHAGLTTVEQLRVFEPAVRGTRKIIVSTNIAEASVTIEGIKFVIDCGYVKVFNFLPVLVVLASNCTDFSRFSDTKGWTSWAYFLGYLLQAISQLKSLGVDDLMKFEWVSAPPAESVLRALEGLVAAGMIGEDGRLTLMGEKVAECPVEVGIARMLFTSKEYSCGEEMLTIAAMTAVQDVFIIPDGAPGALAELERRKFTAEEGDHLTLLNAYNAFVRYGKSSGWCKSHALSFRAMSRAVSIRAQLKKYMQRFNLPLDSCEGDAKRLRRCLVSGYWRNGARWMADGTYRSVRGNAILHVHPTSVLFTRKPRTGWVVFHEMEETKKTQNKEHDESRPDEKVFVNETPIQFSQDVVDQLSVDLSARDVTPERQSTLDAHIRSRIQREIEHLRKEEQQVRERIEQALEKENLDRERSLAGEAVTGDETGSVKDSASLLNDLEDIRQKVDRFHGRKDLQDVPQSREKAGKTLDCWREVGLFKEAVEQLEQKYVKSLQ